MANTSNQLVTASSSSLLITGSFRSNQSANNETKLTAEKKHESISENARTNIAHVMQLVSEVFGYLINYDDPQNQEKLEKFLNAAVASPEKLQSYPDRFSGDIKSARPKLVSSDGKEETKVEFVYNKKGCNTLIELAISLAAAKIDVITNPVLFANHESKITSTSGENNTSYVYGGNKTRNLCTDIHGDFHAMMAFLLEIKIFENPEQFFSKNILINLGDIANRGKRGLLCTIFWLALKVLYGENVVILRGNHEHTSYSMYWSEDLARFWHGRYYSKLYATFTSHLGKLPLCYLDLQTKFFMAHSGPGCVTYDDKIDSGCLTTNDRCLTHLSDESVHAVWADWLDELATSLGKKEFGLSPRQDTSCLYFGDQVARYLNAAEFKGAFVGHGHENQKIKFNRDQFVVHQFHSAANVHSPDFKIGGKGYRAQYGAYLTQDASGTVEEHKITDDQLAFVRTIFQEKIFADVRTESHKLFELCGDEKALKSELEKKANLSEITEWAGGTLLHAVCMRKNRITLGPNILSQDFKAQVGLVELLIYANHVPPNVLDKFGYPAIYYVMMGNTINLSLFTYLVDEVKVDCSILNWRKENLLHMFFNPVRFKSNLSSEEAKQYYVIVEKLLQRNYAQPQCLFVQNNEGKNCLHLLLELGQRGGDFLTGLLNYLLYDTSQDSDRLLPLIMKLLHKVDKNGNTPIQILMDEIVRVNHHGNIAALCRVLKKIDSVFVTYEVLRQKSIVSTSAVASLCGGSMSALASASSHAGNSSIPPTITKKRM